MAHQTGSCHKDGGGFDFGKDWDDFLIVAAVTLGSF
jgi:hypothetical protein